MTGTHTCPACGYPDLDEPPRTGSGGGSYEICDSCGFEYGVTDDDEGFTYAQWRRRWIAKGMPWEADGIAPRPVGWDPKAQVASLEST